MIASTAVWLFSAQVTIGTPRPLPTIADICVAEYRPARFVEQHHNVAVILPSRALRAVIVWCRLAPGPAS
ncbi:MAG: hypothetical protein ACXW13_02580, partial [Burkholderiaceae bacterium]